MKKAIPKLTISSLLILTSQLALAGSATWNANPVDNNWTNPANWTPATVPNSLTDVATFGVTTRTDISIPSDITVAEVVFNSGASAYTFTVGPSSPITYFTIAGTGVTNNSGVTQHMNTPTLIFGKGGFIVITGGATAGDNVAYEVKSGDMYFYQNSSLGNATVTVDAGPFSLTGSTLFFDDESTAATGTIVLNGATGNGAFGGALFFQGKANLANAHLVAHGGTDGERGATAQFLGVVKSEAATIEVDGNASIDLTQLVHGARPFTIGALLGDGEIEGGSELGVGKNNLDSDFSGLWAVGVCVKTGYGTLTWTSPPISNGDTIYTIRRGTLLFADADGTGRGGFGAVGVQQGTFGGNGTLIGYAVIGDGIGSGDAFLVPGLTRKDSAVLTITSTLRFEADGVYNCSFDFRRSTADQVVANGVTIDSGAIFSIIPASMGTIPVGATFIIIDNTSPTTHINGTFNNLADGGTITAGGTNFQANYEGGDGNDLTLTVVP
jgi:hypothetical protein